MALNGAAGGDGPTKAVGLLRGTVFTVTSLAFGQIATAGLYVLGARILGPGPYGQSMSVLASASVLTAISSFGTSPLLSRQIASGDPQSEFDYSWRLIARFRVLILASLAWSVISLAAGAPLTEPWVYLGWITVAQSAAAIAIVPLMANKLQGVAAVSVIVDKTAGFLLGSLLYLGKGLSPLTFLACICLGAIASSVLSLLNWPIQFRSFVQAAIRQTDWKRNPWRGTLHLGLAGLAVAFSSLDVVVANTVAGAIPAGQYAAVSRWVQPMSLVSNGYSQAVFPHLAEASDDRVAFIRLRQGVWWLVALLPAIVIVFWLAPELVDLLIGAPYKASAIVLRWLALGMAAAIVNQPLFSYLQARKHERLCSKIVPLATLLQLLLVVVLTPRNGAVGVGQAFFIGQWFLFAMLVVVATHAAGFLRFRLGVSGGLS